MSSAEIADLCDALPPDKRWESIVAYPKSRPRLDAFLRESAAEGDETLDLNRL